jgi:hypothetical protein
MYVRWKHRVLRRTTETTLVAVLVQSVWQHGQPRQQVVGYLASIRVQYHDAPAHRQAFWQRVEQRLTTLGLSPAIQQAVRQQLARVVPCPTAAELQAVARQRASLVPCPHPGPSAPYGARWRAEGH